MEILNPLACIDRPSATVINNYNTRIHGWIALSKKSELDKVIFIVDGTSLKPTFFDRPDLTNIYDEYPIRSGWVIDAFLKNGNSRLIEFSISLEGQDVIRKTFLRSQSITDKNSRSPLYFMHIPKTAGTSFRELFDYVYKDAPVLYVYNDYPGVPAEKINTLDEFYLNTREAVFGHFATNLQLNITKKNKYVTILRPPKDLVYSYDYFLVDPNATFYDNPLVRHLSGAGYDEPYGGITQTHYEIALKMLKNNVYAIDFLGLQQFSDTLTDLLNIPKFNVPKINVSNKRNCGNLHYEPNLYFDEMLYAYFKEKIEHNIDLREFLITP